MLGHLVYEWIGITELAGEAFDTAARSNQRQGQGGDFSCITIGTGKKLGDLVAGPIGFEEGRQGWRIISGKQRLHLVNKQFRINSCRGFH